MAYILIGYYSDGSSKPVVLFRTEANDAISATNNMNEDGRKVSVFEITEDGDGQVMTIVSGDDLQV